MEFQDDAFVLSARAHGDTGVVVELLTELHGRHAAYVAGGASRRMKPFLQPGARVVADYRARTTEHLGSAKLEPVGEGPAALFDDPLALTGLNAAAAVAQGSLPEREPHPGAFLAFEALMASFAFPDIWPAVFVRFEAGLLEELGFGLDLSRCAATGSARRSMTRSAERSSLCLSSTRSIADGTCAPRLSILSIIRSGLRPPSRARARQSRPVMRSTTRSPLTAIASCNPFRASLGYGSAVMTS